jgi:hypothetical protein
VRLVDHNKVEMPDAEAAPLAARLIDQAHHGRIGRHGDAPLLVYVFKQIDRWLPVQFYGPDHDHRPQSLHWTRAAEAIARRHRRYESPKKARRFDQNDR